MSAPYVTSREAARQLGVTPDHVRYLCAQGLIRGATKTWGGVWKIPAPVIHLGSRRPGP